MREPLAVGVFLFTMLAAGGCGAPGERSDDAGEAIRLFAASSLTDVLEALVDSFETTVPDAPPVKLNLAGSSLLARQIEHGAGADVFVSAHPSWTTYLHESGALRAPATLPIGNRLVLASRREGQRMVDVERLALADPDHVPAGIYARTALECEGDWSQLENRVAATMDVRAALAAVEEGAADAAIVYASDVAFAPRLFVSEPFADDCQPKIRYTIALATSAGHGAELLATYLSDSRRAAVWERFGFASRVIHPDSIRR